MRAEIHALESELYFNINDGARARRHVSEAEMLAAGIEDARTPGTGRGSRCGLQLLGSVELDEARGPLRDGRGRSRRKLSDHSPHARGVSPGSG